MKSFQELTIKDSFMFAAVMNDEEACRRMLEVILGMSILKVTVITEKTMDFHPDYHGIRLDVMAVENGTERRFNVEMQVYRPKDLFRRCRFYHSSMDMHILPGGLDYEILPDSYVIFICDFDPFEQRLYRYSCQMICKETGEFIEDGSKTILLSTKGDNPKDISPELLHFLEYVKDPVSSTKAAVKDTFVTDLDERITAIKRNRNWEVKYMQFMEMLRDEREEGRTQGLVEGRKESLLDLLSESGKIPEDIQVQIIQEKDEMVLKRWFRLAAHAKSFEEFRNNMH